VVSLAKKRLQLEGLTRSAPELQPGGSYDGRPADYALQKFLFFQCTRCHLPYFGGARACGAAAAGGGGRGPAGGAAPFNIQELVCGGCSAGAGQRACQEHGDLYIEWKCQYCCSIAAWFCWGTTHMCDACHVWATRGQSVPTQHCAGRGRCPLQLPHPQPGQEHCLGCSLCRQSQQQL
jgi:E3 ubiquitin-protein ligase MYCBP2